MLLFSQNRKLEKRSFPTVLDLLKSVVYSSRTIIFKINIFEKIFVILRVFPVMTAIQLQLSSPLEYIVLPMTTKSQICEKHLFKSNVTILKLTVLED